MNGFSASEAALEGFRLSRERPGTIAAWSLITYLGVVTIGALMMASLGAPLLAYIRRGGLNSMHADELANAAAASWPAFLGVLAAVILFHSIVTAGICRLVIRPTEPGFAHLRFGADELRLSVVNMILMPVGLLFLAIVDLVYNRVGENLGYGAGLAAAILAAVPMVWMGVRLCLTTPMTFAERRISIGGAWNLTRGHFWALFGMIVLAVIFYIIIWALILMMYFALTQLGGGTSDMLTANGPKASLVAIIILVITLALQMILPVLQTVMIYGPFAVAYQQLHGDRIPHAPRLHPERA